MMDMASRPNITKGAARLNRLIDLNAYPIQPVLRILLKDRTTGENIIWATNNYEKLGNTYHSAATMRLKDLVKLDKSVIQPRVYKTLELQKQRTKVNAEVFTPSWICCLMNNHLDDIWFGRKDVFNKMKDKSWRATNRPIEFPASGSKTWQGYVDSRRIEITCGEAPYLVSRYDTTTGKVIPISHRIGILDRKLRVVNENAENEAEWIKWTLRAYQATYGYEYQGDSLLIARINLLMTFCDYLQERWGRNPTEDELKAVAHILSWNIWQMNGLTYKTSYDADADRQRLQQIIDECDTAINTYTMSARLPDENYLPTLCDLQLSKEYTLQELIDLVKQEDEISLAYMYAEVNGLKIAEEDKRDFDAEIKQARSQLEEVVQEMRLIRDEIYTEKCMIADAPDCLIKNWRMRRTERFRDIAQKNKGKGIMKFDFCIGNPPYQYESLGGNDTYAPPIYHKFMDAAFCVSDKVEMIHPARFLFNAGSTPKQWNKERLDDQHFKVIKYFGNSKEVFTGVGITGGVAITYRDAYKDFGSINVFIEDETLRSIKDKVSDCSSASFSEIVFSAYAHHFSKTLHDEHPNAIAQLSKGHAYDLKSNVFDSIPFCFCSEKPEEYETYKVLGREGNKRSHRYIKRTYIRAIENTAHYKVVIPAAWDAVLCPTIEEPFTITTETFITVGSFETRAEANNCFKYVCTKFARTLLNILKITHHNTPDKWAFVPNQDFTSSSDIDWTKSIREIDQQLYKKYGLSQEEIDFIEKNVKEMT